MIAHIQPFLALFALTSLLFFREMASSISDTEYSVVFRHRNLLRLLHYLLYTTWVVLNFCKGTVHVLMGMAKVYMLALNLIVFSEIKRMHECMLG